MCISASEPSSGIYLSILFCSFSSHILLQNYFASFVDESTCILHLLVVKIFFRYFGMSCFFCFFFSNCLTRSQNLLNLPSFANVFWLIFFQVVFSVCFVLVFSSQHILTRFFFLRILARRIFVICLSNLIFHLGFMFLFGFLRGTPIFISG